MHQGLNMNCSMMSRSVMSRSVMKLSLGPVLYFWPVPILDAFYERVLQSRVDIVYLGEVVCAKRRHYSLKHWLEWANRLQDAGKEVVLSGLTLIESESELGAMKQLCQQGLLLEANDMGLAHLAIESGLPFVGGSTLNLYNANALAYLQQRGMQRWVPPLEMSRQSLQALLQDYQALNGAPLQTEVFCYGRLPLAHSARCYTARFLNLPKDQCDFRCQDYPQGIPLQTQEAQGLFQINGIQTQSFQTCNLLHERKTMHQLGIQIMRFSANDIHCLETLDAFHEQLDDDTMMPRQEDDHCNGYWYGKPGIQRIPVVEG